MKTQTVTQRDLNATEDRLGQSIKDLENRIVDTIQKTIKAAFADFYESIFEPYAERNEREHGEIRKELKGIREEMCEIKEHIKDHDSRLGKVEALTALKN